MVAATYLTIWVALTLFAVAEMARAGRRSWARTTSAAGLALALVHTVLAFDVFHEWSHADAVLKTAQQTQGVFGVAVGAGVYVNYLFFAVWLVDVLLWRPVARPAVSLWFMRAFYLVIILNGAVVFAAGWRRAVGAAVVAALLLAWTRAELFARRPAR
jgi:hypothetical protein